MERLRRYQTGDDEKKQNAWKSLRISQGFVECALDGWATKARVHEKSEQFLEEAKAQAYLQNEVNHSSAERTNDKIEDALERLDKVTNSGLGVPAKRICWCGKFQHHTDQEHGHFITMTAQTAVDTFGTTVNKDVDHVTF